MEGGIDEGCGVDGGRHGERRRGGTAEGRELWWEYAWSYIRQTKGREARIVLCPWRLRWWRRCRECSGNPIAFLIRTVS